MKVKPQLQQQEDPPSGAAVTKSFVPTNTSSAVTPANDTMSSFVSDERFDAKFRRTETVDFTESRK